MKKGITDISFNQIALFAGIGYLIIFITGFFSNFFVLEELVVKADAVSTVNNILASEGLYRLGILSFIVMVIFDAFLAWALYLLLLPVSKNLSLLAAWLRLVNVAIFAVALFNLIGIIKLLVNDEILSFLSADQLNAQVMLLLNNFSITWLIGLIFFGLHLFVIGYLIIMSDMIPKYIGILLVVAALGYLSDSFAYFMLGNYQDYKNIFLLIVVIPGILGELSLTFWLLFKGSRIKINDNP